MTLPLLLEVETLKQHLHDPDLLIVDLCNADSYHHGHIPGAIHVDTRQLIAGDAPAPGLLPPPDQISELFAAIGLSPTHHVVCYDNEGGPWAGRFIWTLDLIGHHQASFLNGGLPAWEAKQYPLEQRANIPQRSAHHHVPIGPQNILIDQLILELGNNPELLIWDARSAAEFSGEKVLSQRGGHIPGAIHCEWTELLDDQKKLRGDLESYLMHKGITADKHIVTHCQTHRRSGLTYIAAKILGYPNVRAYAGSWSEWGNRQDTPVE